MEGGVRRRKVPALDPVSEDATGKAPTPTPSNAKPPSPSSTPAAKPPEPATSNKAPAEGGGRRRKAASPVIPPNETGKASGPANKTPTPSPAGQHPEQEQPVEAAGRRRKTKGPDATPTSTASTPASTTAPTPSAIPPETNVSIKAPAETGGRRRIAAAPDARTKEVGKVTSPSSKATSPVTKQTTPKPEVESSEPSVSSKAPGEAGGRTRKAAKPEAPPVEARKALPANSKPTPTTEAKSTKQRPLAQANEDPKMPAASQSPPKETGQVTEPKASARKPQTSLPADKPKGEKKIPDAVAKRIKPSVADATPKETGNAEDPKTSSKKTPTPPLTEKPREEKANKKIPDALAKRKKAAPGDTSTGEAGMEEDIKAKKHPILLPADNSTWWSLSFEKLQEEKDKKKIPEALAKRKKATAGHTPPKEEDPKASAKIPPTPPPAEKLEEEQENVKLPGQNEKRKKIAAGDTSIQEVGKEDKKAMAKTLPTPPPAESAEENVSDQAPSKPDTPSPHLIGLKSKRNMPATSGEEFMEERASDQLPSEPEISPKKPIDTAAKETGKLMDPTARFKSPATSGGEGSPSQYRGVVKEIRTPSPQPEPAIKASPTNEYGVDENVAYRLPGPLIKAPKPVLATSKGTQTEEDTETTRTSSSNRRTQTPPSHSSTPIHADVADPLDALVRHITAATINQISDIVRERLSDPRFLISGFSSPCSPTVPTKQLPATLEEQGPTLEFMQQPIAAFAVQQPETAPGSARTLRPQVPQRTNIYPSGSQGTARSCQDGLEICSVKDVTTNSQIQRLIYGLEEQNKVLKDLSNVVTADGKVITIKVKGNRGSKTRNRFHMYEPFHIVRKPTPSKSKGRRNE